MRNTKVADIYHTLSQYTNAITVLDPWVDVVRAQREYGIEVESDMDAMQGKRFDAAILAVAHRQFLDMDIRALVPRPGIVYDVKRCLPRQVVDARL